MYRREQTPAPSFILMNIEVTGDRGFIGSALVPVLESLGHTVNGGKTPQLIYHLGAQADVQASIKDPVFDAMANIVGTIAQCQRALISDAKLVYTASAGTETNIKSPYGKSKETGAWYVRWFGTQWGLRYTIVHLHNVYGPGGHSAIDKMLADPEPFTLYGSGHNFRRWTYIDSVISALCDAMSWRGDWEVPSERASVLELLERTKKLYRYAPPVPGEVADVPDPIWPAIGREVTLVDGIAAYREHLGRTHVGHDV